MDDFVQRLLKNINSSNYFPIKRSFGHTLENCNVDAIIAYSKISQNKTTNQHDRNVEFLVSGLCYMTQKPNKSIENKNVVNFETLLKRLNRPGEVENFLKLRYDANGYFHKRFYIIAKKAITCIYPNEIINYSQLIDDLKYWNNTIKIRWAMTIVNIENEGE